MVGVAEYHLCPDGSVEIVRLLKGTSHGDDLRHLIVRQALLRHILTHPQVQVQFSAWEQRLGVRDLLVRIAADRQELAALAGFKTPSELEAFEGALSLDPEAKRQFLLVRERFIAASEDLQRCRS